MTAPSTPSRARMPPVEIEHQAKKNTQIKLTYLELIAQPIAYFLGACRYSECAP
jgi:hypothetical protein